MLYCAKIIEETDLKRRRMKSEDRKMKEIEKVNKHIPFYKVTKESLQRLATTKCNFEEGE